VWRVGIDPRFELARYGERLAAKRPRPFEPLHEALTGEPTLVDTTLDELTRELLTQPPDVVAVNRAVSRNVYGAFRMASTIRAAAPKATLILGGGWVNTELRSLRDPRVFDYFRLRDPR